MTSDTYDKLCKNPFIEDVFKRSLIIGKEITVPNGLKVDTLYTRDPYEEEFYCLQISNCLAHLLTVVEQMEHTVFYMSHFKLSKTMEAAGINRAKHLLWSLENYIIRSQTVYDRLLVLIDRLFHIQNQPNKISHDSIITNAHISRTEIPKLLKPVKTAIKKYYYERNTIIHESAYMEDELRRIEAYSILSSNSSYDQKDFKYLKDDLKFITRDFIKAKRTEFSEVNKKVCEALDDLFRKMHPIYLKKYKELCAK